MTRPLQQSMFAGALLAVFLVPSASAQPTLFARADAHAALRVTFPPLETAGRDSTVPARLVLPARVFDGPSGGQGLHARAIQHSDAYLTRAKIHKYASFATLPLFATELALGQSLYNGTTTDSKRGLHAAVGAGIVGLFGVNTVTGVWNMFGTEGRQDRGGRTLRLVHGLLMLAADAGFVATEATAPGEHEGRFGQSFQNNRSLHRSLAVASISIGTASYLLMLLGHR